MRRTIIFILTLALLGGGAAYFYFSPRLAVAGIRAAAKGNDTDKLAERVDFPKLREGVKAQLNTLLRGKVDRELGKTPFAAFGAAMATVAVDAMVDAYVSPAGIGALAGGLSPRHAAKRRLQPEPPSADATAAAADQGGATPDRPKAEKIAVEFDSLAQASAYVTGKRGEKVRFVLHLDGFRWRLINIVLPPELFGG